MRTFINGIGCISAQNTFDAVFSEGFEVNENDNFLKIYAPPYKDYISPISSRRMANGVKNGIVASMLAIKEAGIDTFDAIITGTGMGCIEDSDKFLKAILDNNEEFLTPTSFIQSTHNTVGAQIALGMQCKAYNFTYVNGAVSFESALMDAKLQIDANEATSILIGGIDEMTDYTQALFKLAGFMKADNHAPYRILDSKTTGAAFSEGATFFVLGVEKTDASYAEFLDIEMWNVLQTDDLPAKVTMFLAKNDLQFGDIDAVILGYNGDSKFDSYYKMLAAHFSDTPQVYYKHLSGEYNTASAFGLYIGANILKTQQIPDILKTNNATKTAFKKILLYNQYRGIDHGFTLISQC